MKGREKVLPMDRMEEKKAKKAQGRWKAALSDAPKGWEKEALRALEEGADPTKSIGRDGRVMHPVARIASLSALSEKAASERLIKLCFEKGARLTDSSGAKEGLARNLLDSRGSGAFIALITGLEKEGAAQFAQSFCMERSGGFKRGLMSECLFSGQFQLARACLQMGVSLEPVKEETQHPLGWLALGSAGRAAARNEFFGWLLDHHAGKCSGEGLGAFLRMAMGGAQKKLAQKALGTQKLRDWIAKNEDFRQEMLRRAQASAKPAGDKELRELNAIIEGALLGVIKEPEKKEQSSLGPRRRL